MLLVTYVETNEHHWYRTSQLIEHKVPTTTQPSWTNFTLFSTLLNSYQNYSSGQYNVFGHCLKLGVECFSTSLLRLCTRDFSKHAHILAGHLDWHIDGHHIGRSDGQSVRVNTALRYSSILLCYRYLESWLVETVMSSQSLSWKEPVFHWTVSRCPTLFEILTSSHYDQCLYYIQNDQLFSLLIFLIPPPARCSASHA